jgi:hypothetical protein
MEGLKPQELERRFGLPVSGHRRSNVADLHSDPHDPSSFAQTYPMIARRKRVPLTLVNFPLPLPDFR